MAETHAAELAAPNVGEGFDDPSLARLAELVYQQSAIVLGPRKATFIKARLAARIRELGLLNTDDYVAFVERDSRELKHLINRITTHETSFFREDDHFAFLSKELFSKRTGPLKIWSAGCASGEEPYSVAITALESDRTRDVEILATDISSVVLSTARTGRYSAERLKPLKQAQRDRFFSAAQEPDGKLGYTIKPLVRQLVSFAQLNLLHPWPMRGPFDAILCRNVMIYFDRPFQFELVRRFTAVLRPGGYLFVGHSEGFGSSNNDELRLHRPAVYQRV